MKTNKWLWVSTIGILILVIFGAIGLMILVGRNTPETSLNSGDQERVTVDFEPGEEITVNLNIDGVTVIIFHDAISFSGTYTFTRQTPILASSSPQDWSRPIIISLSIFDSEGIMVPETSRPKIINIICFSLNNEEWGQLQENKIETEVQFRDESIPNAEWAGLSTTELIDSNRICGITDHLSLFALAVREKENAKENPNETPEPIEPTEVAGEGFTIEIEGSRVRLIVPAEAGLLKGSLIMTLEEPNQFPEAPPEWNREPIVNIIMIDEEGNEVKNPTFPGPIALCFGMNDKTWERYQLSPLAFEIQSYDKKIFDPIWESIEVIENLEDQELCGALLTTGLFALAENLSSVGRTPAPYQP